MRPNRSAFLDVNKVGRVFILSHCWFDVFSAQVDQQSGEGILGLGLASLSAIYRSSSNNANDTKAQPVIYSIFNQNPTSPRFISLSIDRSDDMERTSGGVLSISEYDPRYATIANTTKHSLAPINSSRWTIAMDKLEMNGENYNLTSEVQRAAANTSIALIDSGTSLGYIPVSAVDFIYGNIAGAVHLRRGDEDVWIVPCLEAANLTFSFGYVAYVFFCHS